MRREIACLGTRSAVPAQEFSLERGWNDDPEVRREVAAATALAGRAAVPRRVRARARVPVVGAVSVASVGAPGAGACGVGAFGFVVRRAGLRRVLALGGAIRLPFACLGVGGWLRRGRRLLRCGRGMLASWCARAWWCAPALTSSCSGVAMCAGVSAVPCVPSIPLVLGEASAVAAATFLTAPDAESFPRTTPLPGTLTPRGATCASRCPDARAAADAFGEELCVICSAPVTAAPPATVTATTAAAAFIATPPAKNPPLAAPQSRHRHRSQYPHRHRSWPCSLPWPSPLQGRGAASLRSPCRRPRAP